MPPVYNDRATGAGPTPAAGPTSASSPSSTGGAGVYTAPATGTAVPPGAPAAEQCVPDPDYKPNPAVEAFGRVRKDLDELKEYAGLYVSAKVDGIKGTGRRIGLYAALGVVGAVVGGAMLATAAGLVVVGIARGLGALFGGRVWLGDLVTGIVILGAVAAAAYFMMRKLTGTWRSQTLKKYEQRKQNERERFGHDVSERARQAAAAARRAAAAAAAAGGPGRPKGL